MNSFLVTRPQYWTLSVALIVFPLTVASGQSAQYAVDGFVLGDKVVSDSVNFQNYDCAQSAEFRATYRCERRQRKKGSAGTIEIVGDLVYADDGTILRASIDATPVRIDVAAVKKEIQALTAAIGQEPSFFQWFKDDADIAQSLIASWGDIELEEIYDDDALSRIKDGSDRNAQPVVGLLGDPNLSIQNGMPVYRVTGGSGYIYSAHFSVPEKGSRHYLALNAADLSLRRFRTAFRNVLRRDKLLAKDDYRLWPDVAYLARNIALETSVEVANKELDDAFSEVSGSKLDSRVWSIMPTGAIGRLALGRYWRHDVYGLNTQYPEIRQAAMALLASRPDDLFREFAHFIVGDFGTGLRGNPKIIGDVLNYARGYQVIQSFAAELYEWQKAHSKGEIPQEDHPSNYMDIPGDFLVNDQIREFNLAPDEFGNQKLDSLVSDFPLRASEARMHFAKVLEHRSSPLADDAAYMLGWLERQSGDLDLALKYFGQVLTISGPGLDDSSSRQDYKVGALKEVIRLTRDLPIDDQVRIITSAKVLEQQPGLWYTAARSAYREFDYALAIEIAERGLSAGNVPVDRLPVSTDVDRIWNALSAITPRLYLDANVVEMPYLIEASREFLKYERMLGNYSNMETDDLFKEVRRIVLKYSLLIDSKDNTSGNSLHKDLRQAVHLIDVALRETPRDVKYGPMREWLYYRKARILVEYTPQAIATCVNEMREEFPSSQLLDDALAEQIFAEGQVLGDLKAAEKTFTTLLASFPDGNGVDNAFNWMAIFLRNAGLTRQAEEMDREIIRRFPLTRHANYASKRLASTNQ